jgi:hypothetical protein
MDFITYMLIIFTLTLYGLFFSFAIAFELNAKEIRRAILTPSIVLAIVLGAALILLKLGAAFSGYYSLFSPLDVPLLFFFISYLVWAPISIHRLGIIGFQKLHEKYGLDKTVFKRITPWSKSRIIKNQMQP